MNWKRLLQVAVCLVLVCALLVGVSPIKVNAFLLPGLTDDVVCGIIIATIMLSSGLIIEPPDQQFFEDASEALRHFVVDNMYFPGGDSGDGGDDDGDDDLTPEELAAKLAAETAKLGATVREQVGSGMRGLELSGNFSVLLSAFIYDLISQGYFEREVETPAATGWTYYGDYLIPTLPDIDGYPYKVITRYNNKKFIVTYSDQPLYWNALFACMSHPDGTAFICQLHIEDSSISAWDSYSSYSIPTPFENSSIISYTSDTFVWSNYDIVTNGNPVTLKYAGSEPSTTTTTTENIEPIATVGSIVDGIIAGGLTAADIPIPETVDLSSIFEGVETGGLDAVVGNMKSSAAGLASGAISLSDFQQSITYVDDGSGDDIQDPTEDPSPTEGADSEIGDGEQIPIDGPLSEAPTNDFLSNISNMISAPFEWLWNQMKAFFSSRIQSIGEWFSEVRQDIQNIPAAFSEWFSNISNGITDFRDSVAEWFSDVIDMNQAYNQLDQEIQQEQNNIIEQGFASVSAAVAGGLASAFVPEDGFFQEKVDSLCDEYTFAASIADTAKDMESFLTNLGSVPPVIRINLGASSGKYNYGSNMVLIDFSFYEPYKAQMDVILSAFLWLWFCWRVILTLPGIISGASGAVGSFSDASGVGKRGYVELSDSLKGNPVSASHFVPEMDRKHGGRKT